MRWYVSAASMQSGNIRLQKNTNEGTGLSRMLETMCAYTEFNMRGIAKLESLKMRDDQPIPRKHFVDLVYGTMCTLLSTKSIARGWEPVRDATVTKPNPLTSRLWGSHAAAKNPHPTGTYLIRLPFMGPPMVTHAGRGHNICQESRNTSKLPLTLSRVWHIGVANPRRRVP